MTVEHEDQLLAGVLHRLVAAVGLGLHRGDAPARKKRPYGPEMPARSIPGGR